MKGKKGAFDLGDMLPLGMTIVVLGIALSLGLTVLGDFRKDQCVGFYNSTEGACYTNSTQAVSSQTVEFNATSDASTGLQNFTGYLPTIALVIVVAVIIGIIVRYLFMNR